MVLSQRAGIGGHVALEQVEQHFDWGSIVALGSLTQTVVLLVMLMRAGRWVGTIEERVKGLHESVKEIRERCDLRHLGAPGSGYGRRAEDRQK